MDFRLVSIPKPQRFANIPGQRTPIMMKPFQALVFCLALAVSTIAAQAQGHYKSFIVSTYAVQGTVRSLMSGEIDPAQSWATLTRNLKVDKIYIEVMRNHTLVDEA